MSQQDGVFTLYPRFLPDQKAIGILITRGGAERFDLFPLNGREEGRAIGEEVTKILHRRAGPPSGQIIRLPGETMMSLSEKDLGYQFRPMGEAELDWHESLFEDWSSRHVPRAAEPPPAEVAPETPSLPPVRKEAANPDPASGAMAQNDVRAAPSKTEPASEVSRPSPAPDQRGQDIESVRLLLRSLLRDGTAEEINAEISDLRRDLAQFSAALSQPALNQEAVKARLDLINQRLLAIERDRLDFSARFDASEKVLQEICLRLSTLQPEKKKPLVLRIAQAVLSTFLVALMCLTAFLAGIAMSERAGDFLRGGVWTPEHLQEDPAHSGADWAGSAGRGDSERITQNQTE